MSELNHFTKSEVTLANRQLRKVLKRIAAGQFVEIERCSGARSISLVALRFTGDLPCFTRGITAMLEDACLALERDQTIWIRVTDG